MPQFLYKLLPVRPEMPNAPTEAEMEIVGRHFMHLKANCEAGKVKLAGRTMGEDVFGICVFESETEDDARAFMESDPAVAEGVMRATLYPFAIALQSL